MGDLPEVVRELRVLADAVLPGVEGELFQGSLVEVGVVPVSPFFTIGKLERFGLTCL